MHKITAPLGAFEAALRQAAASATRLSQIPASIRHLPDGLEAIARTGHPPADADGPRIGLLVAESLVSRPPVHDGVFLALLEVGIGPSVGRIHGWIRESTQEPWRPAEVLSLPGPEMLRIPIDPLAPPDPGPRIHWDLLPIPGPEPTLPFATSPPPAVDRSRTRAALGRRVARAIAESRIGFVGLGRMNSLLAEECVRFGCDRVVTVDADHVESHNAAESSIFGSADRGAKVEVAGPYLRRVNPSLEYVGIAESVTHVRAMEALSQCDVLCVSADSPHGWVVSGALASCFQRLLLGVGTQVNRPGTTPPASATEPAMSFDVRLIYPGDGACLLCLGGVGTQEERLAAELIREPDLEASFFRGRNWRRERPGGSLRSLNLVAAGLALRLLEDAFLGRIVRSTWLQGDFDSAGNTQIRRRTPASSRVGSQDLCACHLAGSGWFGIRNLGPLLARRSVSGAPPTRGRRQAL